MHNIIGEYIVITNNINIFTFIANSKGFGINTDLFETNVLNLSVVVGTLIYYGKIALGDLIKNRKETVVKNLKELENKVKESEEILALAKANLETAKIKSEQIRQQGTNLSIQTSKSILYAIEEDIKRLRNVNLSTIKMEEKKSLSEVCQKLSSFAFKKAGEIINKRLNSKFHRKLVSKNIEKLSKKKLKVN